MQRRGLALSYGAQAIQQQLQIGFDLQLRRAAVNLVGGSYSLGRYGRPVGLGQFLAALGMQCLDQVGQQNRPTDVERQNILSVEDGNKRRFTVGLVAGDQMDAHHTGPVGVQGHMPHTGKMPVQKGMFRIGQVFHRGKFLRSLQNDNYRKV